ncbi:MAG TPA: TetR/AcrR family transcriptional regulator [Arsenicitalea sp.]|nr:TetR/AcrR family transcriptional regulator [Arsenicitalea sp.]
MTDKTTARGPYQTGIKRRQDIIDAAAQVFAKFGYTSGSLRQIAEDVGVTPSALIRHFNSKEGLLVAVLARLEEENRRIMSPPYEGLEYYRRLPNLLANHTNHRGFVELLMTLSTEASNPRHPAREFITKRYDHVVSQGVQRLQEARAIGDILPMDDALLVIEVRGFFAQMDGLQLQWLLDPSIDLVGIFRHYLDVTLARWTGKPLPDAAARGRTASQIPA